jgi:hypothetical protein
MKRVTTWRRPRRDPNIPLDRKKVYFFVGGVVLASLIIAVVVIFFVDPVPPPLASLSKEAIRLAHRQPGYFIMRCTMDGCQAPCSDCRSNDYGSWVQMSTSIGNPFMGKLSPNCGARIQ